jgi:hypothetical protein
MHILQIAPNTCLHAARPTWDASSGVLVTMNDDKHPIAHLVAHFLTVTRDSDFRRNFVYNG